MAAALAVLGERLRSAIEITTIDADARELLTGLSRRVDESLWFVEARRQSDR